MSEEQKPVYLTLQEVACRYKISPRTVWRWIAIGKLPTPQSFGYKMRRWDFKVLEEWEKRAVN